MSDETDDLLDSVLNPPIQPTKKSKVKLKETKIEVPTPSNKDTEPKKKIIGLSGGVKLTNKGKDTLRARFSREKSGESRNEMMPHYPTPLELSLEQIECLDLEKS